MGGGTVGVGWWWCWDRFGTTRNNGFNIARLTSVLEKIDVNKNAVTYS